MASIHERSIKCHIQQQKIDESRYALTGDSGHRALCTLYMPLHNLQFKIYLFIVSLIYLLHLLGLLSEVLWNCMHRNVFYFFVCIYCLCIYAFLLPISFCKLAFQFLWSYVLVLAFVCYVHISLLWANFITKKFHVYSLFPLCSRPDSSRPTKCATVQHTGTLNLPTRMCGLSCHHSSGKCNKTYRFAGFKVWFTGILDGHCGASGSEEIWLLGKSYRSTWSWNWHQHNRMSNASNGSSKWVNVNSDRGIY